MAVLSLLALKNIEEASTPPFWYRLQNAVVSYAEYVSKMIAPSKLAVFYPVPAYFPGWEVAGSTVLLAAASIFAIKQGAKTSLACRRMAVVPDCSFPHDRVCPRGLWPEMADRFTYVPMIGLFIIIAWTCAEIRKRSHVNAIIIRCAAVEPPLSPWPSRHGSRCRIGRTVFRFLVCLERYRK